MKIVRFDDQKRGLFKAVENNEEAGALIYVWDGTERIIIEHTEVKANFNGHGIGKLLVTEAVKYAREQKIKILPLCPFAKTVFDKNVDLQDVLS